MRASVFFAVAVQCLFLIFLTVFLFNHADLKGDGMEMVGVGAAFILAKEGRLVAAALLAGLAAFLYFALWFQLLDELGIQPAPWR